MSGRRDFIGAAGDLAAHDARWKRHPYFVQLEAGAPWLTRFFVAGSGYATTGEHATRAAAKRALRAQRRGKVAPAPVTLPAPKPRPEAAKAKAPAVSRSAAPGTVITFYSGADSKLRRRVESIARRGFPLVSLPLKPAVIRFGGAQRMSRAEVARVVDMSGLHVADTWPRLLDLLKRRSVAAGEYHDLTPSDYLAAMGLTFDESADAWSCGCKGREAAEPCQRHARCVSWEAFNDYEDAGLKAGRRKAAK